MAIIIKKCRNCNKVYEVERFKIGLGIPFTKCPFCDSIIIDKSYTEWELKSISTKIGYFLILLYSVLLYGLIIPIIFVAVNELTSRETKTDIFFYIWIGSIFIFAYFIVSDHLKNVVQSKKRMQNQEYRDQLIKLGLLKK